MKDDNKRTGEKQNVKSKIKSAIYRKVNKNAQSDKSAQCDGNKQIADFIFAKERSDFCKSKARDCRCKTAQSSLTLQD